MKGVCLCFYPGLIIFLGPDAFIELHLQNISQLRYEQIPPMICPHGQDLEELNTHTAFPVVRVVSPQHPKPFYRQFCIPQCCKISLQKKLLVDHS